MLAIFVLIPKFKRISDVPSVSSNPDFQPRKNSGKHHSWIMPEFLVNQCHWWLYTGPLGELVTLFVIRWSSPTLERCLLTCSTSSGRDINLRWQGLHSRYRKYLWSTYGLAVTQNLSLRMPRRQLSHCEDFKTSWKSKDLRIAATANCSALSKRLNVSLWRPLTEQNELVLGLAGKQFQTNQHVVLLQTKTRKRKLGWGNNCSAS